VVDSGPGGRRFKSSLPDQTSLALSIVYVAFAASILSAVFGTFGTTEGLNLTVEVVSSIGCEIDSPLNGDVRRNGVRRGSHLKLSKYKRLE
jgi:hypothetical protein